MELTTKSNEEQEIANPIMSRSNAKETISVSLNTVNMKKMLKEAEKRTRKAL